MGCAEKRLLLWMQVRWLDCLLGNAKPFERRFEQVEVIGKNF
jgi:hypothetical protein